MQDMIEHTLFEVDEIMEERFLVHHVCRSVHCSMDLASFLAYTQ